MSSASGSALAFLEQFRYMIVASQLLNDHSNRSSHKTAPLPSPRSQIPEVKKPEVTLRGLMLVLLFAAFVIPFLKWEANGVFLSSSRLELAARLAAIIVFSLSLSLAYRHGRLQRLRRNIICATAEMVSALQDFEDHLVMFDLSQTSESCSDSNTVLPTPTSFGVPAAALDNNPSPKLQIIFKAVSAITSVSNAVVERLHGLSVASDLEKYYEIYDIGRKSPPANRRSSRFSGSITQWDPTGHLKRKTELEKFHAAVRLLLCTLLALDVGQSSSETEKWPVVCQHLMSVSAVVDQSLRSLLASANVPSLHAAHTSSRVEAKDKCLPERGQASLMIELTRSLIDMQSRLLSAQETTKSILEQAQSHSREVADLSFAYRDLGFNLKDMLSEWERGLQLWHTTDRLHSTPPANRRHSIAASQPSSSDGSFMFEGGPEEALQALHGRRGPASDTSEESSALEPRILEGVARTQVQGLSPQGRRARSQNAQSKQQAARDSAMVTASFVRELEHAIQRRPLAPA